VRKGITVVAAVGNEGERRLLPPATAPDALTIGGLDDRNNFLPDEVEVWHSNYGESVAGLAKPELVAPSIWVVAPVLPGSEVAAEARKLFAQRHLRDVELEERIAELKFVTPHYQHVEGTSFAAPLVASFVACMLEANPALTPDRIRTILIDTAQPVERADRERQGAGALVPCLALAAVLREPGAPLHGLPLSPHRTEEGIHFYLYEPNAAQVHVQGNWDDWCTPGLEAEQLRPGVWHALLPDRERDTPGRCLYRFIVDEDEPIADPENPARSPNRVGGFDSVIVLK
jgi:serine protease AprX